MFDWLFSCVSVQFIAQVSKSFLLSFWISFLCRASSRHGLYFGIFVCIYRRSLHTLILSLLPSNLTCTRVRIHTSGTLQYPIPFKTISQHHVSAYVNI